MLLNAAAVPSPPLLLGQYRPTPSWPSWPAARAAPLPFPAFPLPSSAYIKTLRASPASLSLTSLSRLLAPLPCSAVTTVPKCCRHRSPSSTPLPDDKPPPELRTVVRMPPVLFPLSLSHPPLLWIAHWSRTPPLAMEDGAPPCRPRAPSSNPSSRAPSSPRPSRLSRARGRALDGRILPPPTTPTAPRRHAPPPPDRSAML